MVTPWDFIHIQFELTNITVPCESTAKEVSSEKNIIGFHPQTQKLELHTQ